VAPGSGPRAWAGRSKLEKMRNYYFVRSATTCAERVASVLALRSAALLAILALAAACGGADRSIDKTSGAYQGAFQVCTNTPLKQHALELSVAAKPEAVADAVAVAIAGTHTGREYENGRQGCLDAYSAKG
jgi:hypothetical protein